MFLELRGLSLRCKNRQRKKVVDPPCNMLWGTCSLFMWFLYTSVVIYAVMKTFPCDKKKSEADFVQAKSN